MQVVKPTPTKHMGVLRSRRPCLLRSLTMYRHCRGRGAPVSIHFGVRRGREGLEGHSWVSLHGVPLFEAIEMLQSYTSIYTYPDHRDTRDLDWVLGIVKGRS